MNTGARLWALGTGKTSKPDTGLLALGSRFSPEPSAKRQAPVGFTLIELAVVLLILSITAMLVMPRLFPGDDAALKSSARTLASTLRYLQDRAIATRSNFNLKFQFPDGTIAVNTVTDTGEEGAADDGALRDRILAEGVSVEDVVLNSLGRINDGEVIVRVGMAGLQELLTVHLKSRGGTYTVIAYPVSGKVRIEEGYREATL